MRNTIEIPDRYQNPSRTRIEKLRDPKGHLDSREATTFFIEEELNSQGILEEVAVVILVNKECPLRCSMCDLWENTLDVPTPAGHTTLQIQSALAQLPKTEHIKLYNAGNFFDTKAIPLVDRKSIANLVRGFKTIVVENHPKINLHDAEAFNDLIDGGLEIAIGLETVQNEVFEFLNKSMTLTDFENAVQYLSSKGVSSRAFILTGLPFMTEEENELWALRSIDFAFEAGVKRCSVIPLRSSNGLMREIGNEGLLPNVDLSHLERILDQALIKYPTKVSIDLWDADPTDPAFERIHLKNRNEV